MQKEIVGRKIGDIPERRVSYDSHKLSVIGHAIMTPHMLKTSSQCIYFEDGHWATLHSPGSNSS